MAILGVPDMDYVTRTFGRIGFYPFSSLCPAGDVVLSSSLPSGLALYPFLGTSIFHFIAYHRLVRCIVRPC